MRIRLQVRHMWEAVQDGDVGQHEDRRALDALIAAVPPEMQFSLSIKRTAKEAWDTIAATRIGSDRARKSTLQALRKEWESLAFKPGEDVDDLALRLNTVAEVGVAEVGDVRRRQLRRGKSYRKALSLRPREVQYKQMARSIESLLDLSTMSIEEAIGRLKVVDTDEPQLPSGPITTGGKLLLTREQWDACRRRGSLFPRLAATSVARRAETPRPGREDVPRVMPAEAPRVAPPAGAGQHETTPAAPAASLAIGPGTVDSHDAPRPTSHRRRKSQLCSWHMRASSYLQRHRPQRLFFTLTNQKHTLSSATAPIMTRLTGGASTPAPPIT
jgi:hypothetical protein